MEAVLASPNTSTVLGFAREAISGADSAARQQCCLIRIYIMLNCIVIIDLTILFEIHLLRYNGERSTVQDLQEIEPIVML